MTSDFSIYPHLLSVASHFKGILLDAYGVFWGGNRIGLFPGAKETMKQLVAEGKIVGILSNTTQLAEKERQKLEKQGLEKGIHYHFLMTSGEVARSFFLNDKLPFLTPNKKYWLWGTIHPHFSSHQPIFEGTPYQQTEHLSEADFIYISIPHLNGEDVLDGEIFREELKNLAKTGLIMVCPNPDHFAQEGSPVRLVVRQGSIAKLYAELGGRVFYIGKPSDAAYQAAMNCFSSYHIKNPGEILMVGDTPMTDIRGARQFGMSSALVTETGILTDQILNKGLSQVFESFDKSDHPHFFIKKLSHFG